MRMDNYGRFCKIALLQIAARSAISASNPTGQTQGQQEPHMSHHDNHHAHHADSVHEPDPADSRADAIAAFFAIAIAVSGVLYFISQQ